MTTEMTTTNGTAAAVNGHGEAPYAGIIERPDTDIYETDDHVVVIADMPGVSAEDIDVRLERRTLTIRARTSGAQPEGYRRVHAEHDVAGYERVFTLSRDIDQDGIEAGLRDGILTLRLPKAETARTRRIAVEAA